MLFQKIDNPFYRKKKTLQLNGELIQLDQPLVMGILNLTPDSFYDGGRYKSEQEVLQRAEEILAQGGTMIDIGAVSTRPGASEVGEEEELLRLLPAVKAIRKAFPWAVLSVDSFRSGVVERVFGETGGFLVNDISGGTLDGKMFETVAKLGDHHNAKRADGHVANPCQENHEWQKEVVEVVEVFQEAHGSYEL